MVALSGSMGFSGKVAWLPVSAAMVGSAASLFATTTRDGDLAAGYFVGELDLTGRSIPRSLSSPLAQTRWAASARRWEMKVPSRLASRSARRLAAKLRSELVWSREIEPTSAQPAGASSTSRPLARMVALSTGQPRAGPPALLGANRVTPASGARPIAPCRSAYS